MRRLFAWLLLCCLPACGTPRVIETAFYGDLASLKKEIARAQRSGALDDRSDVEDLARAVARREIRSATGRAAVDRVRALRPCAHAVLPELEERAETPDDAGAEAMLVLGELGKRDFDRMRREYARASSGAWRALAARGTASRRHGPLRRAFLVDVDERVRRQALRAALLLGDPSDRSVLFETARLDPDPVNRSLAIRAIGAIGGRQTVLSLKDLFPTAIESQKLAIVEAWALPPAFGTGGEGQLVRIAESDLGLPKVAAAHALARSKGDSAETGRAVLVRSVREGATDERRLAIQLVPLAPAAEAALLDAARDPDEGVSVPANARLLESTAHRAAARGRLRSMAKRSDSAGAQARAVLAAVQDFSVSTQLRSELDSRQPGRRRLAATGLVQLGGATAAATALADDDPSVRVSVACSLLARPD